MSRIRYVNHLINHGTSKFKVAIIFQWVDHKRKSVSESEVDGGPEFKVLFYPPIHSIGVGGIKVILNRESR